MAEKQWKVEEFRGKFVWLKKLDITIAECVLVDLVHSLTISKRSKFPGWCYASKEYLAAHMNISKRAVQKMLNRMKEKGLLEQGKNRKHLQSTSKWVHNTYLTDEENDIWAEKPIPQKLRINDEKKIGNKVPSSREQSSLSIGNKVPSSREQSSLSPRPPNRIMNGEGLFDINDKTGSLGENGSKQPGFELDFSKVAETVFKSCPFAKKNISIENLTNHLLKMYSRADWICYHLNRLRAKYDTDKDFKLQEENRGQWGITITRWFLKEKQIEQNKGGIKKLASRI